MNANLRNQLFVISNSSFDKDMWIAIVIVPSLSEEQCKQKNSQLNIDYITEKSAYSVRNGAYQMNLWARFGSSTIPNM